MNYFFDRIGKTGLTDEDMIRDIEEMKRCIPAIQEYFERYGITSSEFQRSGEMFSCTKPDKLYGGEQRFDIRITSENYTTTITRGEKVSTQVYDKKTGIEMKRVITRDGGQELFYCERDLQHLDKATFREDIIDKDEDEDEGIEDINTIENTVDIAESTSGNLGNIDEVADIGTLDSILGKFYVMAFGIFRSKIILWNNNKKGMGLEEKIEHSKLNHNYLREYPNIAEGRTE